MLLAELRDVHAAGRIFSDIYDGALLSGTCRSAVWNPVCTAQAVWLFRDLDRHRSAVS